MFIKSLKHEFRAVARIVLPLLIALIAASMLMSIGFIMDGRLFSPDTVIEEPLPGEIIHVGSEVIQNLETLLLVAMIFLFIAISISVFVMIVRRFYTSFFTDEGYLTFTLPVSMDCHLMVKIVSMFLWALLSGIVSFIAVAIILLGIELGYDSINIAELFSKLSEEFGLFFEFLGMELKYDVLTVILTAIYPIVLSICECISLYFAISLGCMIVKKHRLLAGMISFSLISSVLSSISSVGVTLIGKTSLNGEIAYISIMSINIAVTAVFVIAGYLGTKYILIHKLNLD